MEDVLRVGLVCPYSFSRPGGVQNHVLGLAGWLRAQGHHPQIIAPGHPAPEMLTAQGLTAEVFTSAGRALPVPYNGSVARVGLGPVNDLLLRRWLEVQQLDLLHLHEPMTPSISLLALARARIPVAATFHTATPGSRTMKLAYRLAPAAARRVDAPIAVSRVAQQVAGAHGGPWPVVIGNGIRTGALDTWAGHPPARDARAPRLVFIGRHDEPRKGLGVLLEALDEIRTHHRDVQLHVVGHGRPRTIEGVHFLGPLDDGGRNRLLASCDAYVAPHTGRESFGIVLLEAMACGAPVVCSDLPAFREVVSDEQGPVAELFPAGEASALARAVLRVLDAPDPERLRRARVRAGDFDWSRVGPQLLDAYQHARHAFHDRSSGCPSPSLGR